MSPSWLSQLSNGEKWDFCCSQVSRPVVFVVTAWIDETRPPDFFPDSSLPTSHSLVCTSRSFKNRVRYCFVCGKVYRDGVMLYGHLYALLNGISEIWVWWCVSSDCKSQRPGRPVLSPSRLATPRPSSSVASPLFSTVTFLPLFGHVRYASVNSGTFHSLLPSVWAALPLRH